MKRFATYILTALAACACVYPLDIDTEEYSGNTLVVDASIIIGGKSTVTLSHLMPLDGGGFTYAGDGNAEVILESDQGDKYSDSTAPYTINTAGASAACKYRLVVKCDGKTYCSDWIKPLPAPKISDVSFSADERTVQVSVSANGQEGGQGYAAIQYDEIWKFHAEYVRIFDYNVLNNSIDPIQEPDYTYYICWNKSVNVQETLVDYTSTGGIVTEFPFLTFPRTNERNQYEYDILVKIRNLSPEEFRYFRHLEEGAGNGSLFSPEPGNAESNVICESDPSEKVFGYVSVSCQDYYIATLDSRYHIYGNPGRLTSVDPEDYYKYYSMGYLPVNYSGNGIGWGTPRCYNCVSAGGTLFKPSFDLPNAE